MQQITKKLLFAGAHLANNSLFARAPAVNQSLFAGAPHVSGKPFQMKNIPCEVILWEVGPKAQVCSCFFKPFPITINIMATNPSNIEF